MNEALTTICYGAMFLATVFTLRRAKYSWVAAVLGGLVGPLAFIVLYAILGFPLSMLAGKLHMSEDILPQNVLSLVVAVIVVAGWFAGGLFLTRQKHPPKTPNESAPGG
jgi:hypothetical protein